MERKKRCYKHFYWLQSTVNGSNYDKQAARKRASEQRSRFLSSPLTIASPFACGSRVTSPDGLPNACSRATLLIVLMFLMGSKGGAVVRALMHPAVDAMMWVEFVVCSLPCSESFFLQVHHRFFPSPQISIRSRTHGYV